MSTFSSDRVGETIIPDLTKRFRRGYIDYFDRKNGTDRPVEEIPTRSIIPLDQFEGLMKLLDDIVLFSAATPELATKFQGLWNRLDLPDKDDKDRIECTRMGLISFESYIKVFIYLLCGNGDLLRQIDAEKRGLGYILNNLSVPSPDGKSGLFDARYAGLFDTLRRYRNGITHSPSDTGVSESDILTVRKNPNDAYDELFLLTLTGLLLLLHHHAGYYRRYLDEHRPELPPEKAAAASPADDFDLERFKDRYLEELLGEQNRELKQKVGFIGRIDNQQTLNLLPLKLQRRQDAGEGLSDPDYGGRPHESGDFTDGEQGGMAMDDLIDAGDRISLILGNPGAGKTTVLIRLIRQYADLWHNGDRSILPLRINLNAVTEGQTMDDALRTAFNAGFGITTTEDRKRMVFAHAEQLLAEGRIALFIDGLNELKVSRPELFIASLGSFIAKYDKCRFHITGRIHEFAACREAFRRIEGCGVYHLCEISLDQILLYLRQLGLPEERIDEFRLQIIRAGIEELLGTPLNFMMIAALLLGSTEYKIPAVGNRGELLEMFMRSSLSVRSREKLVDEAVNFNAFDLLQQMAWRIAAEGQRVLREDFVIEIARDPRYKGADRVEKLVDSLIGLHIVEQSVDHKGSWLTFFVDTYLEYFFARRLALDFCERHAPLPGQLDVTNERNFEILKLTLELICSGWVRKEGCIADGRDFVKALYDLGRNPAQPAATTTADGVLQTEGLPSKPAVNGNLALVARMASGLKPYTDKTNPNARLLIESWLLNTMVVYRIGHPVPDTEGDYDYIRQLTECAVVLSSERIFRELFSDYWLTTLLLTVADDFGMQLPENSVKASALHRALIDNCTDVRLFYRFLHSRYLDLVLFRPRSALRIRKFLSLLFGNLKKYTQKLLYGYIAEWREADAQRQGGDHYLAQDANTLLLCIDDVDYLISRYDLPAAERSRTKIGWSQLRKLVRNYDDERLAAFIFTERFFGLLQNREQMALYLFRYYIFRNHFPRCLMQFLFEGTGRKGISPGNLSELLDAFPLEKIPVGEARKRYDNEIYDYLTQETHSEESDDGLIYRAERLVNWSPQMRTTLSDIEVEHKEVEGELVSMRYGDGDRSIVVATTRVETMLGDTAVAVHPDDERYRHLVGTEIAHPLTGRTIPVVADDYVDPEFGSGAVKITPAHDPNDFEIGKRHDLPMPTIMDESGRIAHTGTRFDGMDRFEARVAVREALRSLQAQGVLRMSVGTGPDSGTTVAALPNQALTRFLRLHVALANFPLHDVVEARLMLERQSARDAALRATESELDELGRLVDAMDDPDLDRDRFNELDTAFHVAIAEAGGNRLVADMTTAIRESLRLPLRRAFHDLGDSWTRIAEGLRADHRAVLEALRARDGDAAERHMTDHIRDFYAKIPAATRDS